MDCKALEPKKLDFSPSTPSSAKQFNFWLKTFENFLKRLQKASADIDKLDVLTNCLTADSYEYISECVTYELAITELKNVFIKPPNIVFARHQLSSCKQNPGESVDEYLQVLKVLGKNCNFESVRFSSLD